MKKLTPEIDLAYLLRLAAILWLVYLLALLIIDHALYREPVFPPHYYWLNGVNALFILGLGLSPWGRTRLGPKTLAPIIILISLIPVLTSNVGLLGVPPSRANAPEAVMVRIMPMLFVPLILTAWQYRWPIVILYSVGVNLFALGIHIAFYRPGGASILPPIIVLIIQTISFLVVGYFINVLMAQLKQQQIALEEAHARLVDYTGTLEELTISRERNRLARELHDTLAHTLSALSVQLETARAYSEVDAATTQQLLDQSLSVTRSGLQETRRALKALRAAPLEDLGLPLALHRLAEETADRAGLRLNLSLPAHLPQLPSAVEQTLYRIAQEALANVAHHANAHTLTVTLTQTGQDLSLSIKDDGIGFDPHSARPTDHFGLPGMQERAAMIDGDLKITSAPGAGTQIELLVPLI